MNATLTATLPKVQERLQQLTPEELGIVERVLLQLEINRTVAELDDLTDGLRANGMMAKLPDIIRQVRASHQPTAP
jgi:hypothetical protein